MKRWAPWLAVVLVLCSLVFAGRSSSPVMLEDTDTSVLLAKIREVQDPLAWFRGDWPLQNHFYRPISTLSFELDDAVSGAREGASSGHVASVFGTTNALLAVCSILLLFWFLREATDSPWLTGSSAALFALWHMSVIPLQWLGQIVAWGWVVCLIGLLRGRGEKLLPIVLASCGCLFLSDSLFPLDDFGGWVMEWIPGRTASVMTVFALLSLASYSRVVRLSARREHAPATAVDVPATKSATVGGMGGVERSMYLSLGAIALVLALGSYEQAVMLPALLFGVWLMFRLRGYRSAWWPHTVFWALLVGYLFLRYQLVPSDVSGYQTQQLRTGPGVWVSLVNYMMPSLYWLYMLGGTLSAGLMIVNTTVFWSPVAGFVGNVAALVRGWTSRDQRWVFVGFFLLSFFAFLPMAWLKQFGHYHYLPSALRAPFVVLMFVAVFRLVASAVSLPELRAPERRGPAPGSLLRP